MVRFMILILSLLIAIAFVGSGIASPPGKTVEYAGGDQGKVIFKGDTHGTKQGMKCNDCHPKLFAMKKGTFKMSKENHGKAEYCGICHDGKKAFSQSTEADCTKCHKKEEVKPEEVKPEEVKPEEVMKEGEEKK